MLKHCTHRLVTLFILMMMLGSGCAGDSNQGMMSVSGESSLYKHKSSTDYGELVGYNFHPGMRDIDVYMLGSTTRPASPGDVLLGIAERKSSVCCCLGNLTPKEQWTLGVRKLSEGKYDCLQMQFSALRDFYYTNKRLPIDGIEMYQELDLDASGDSFMQLSEKGKYIRCCHAINTITGGFHKSFTDSNWNPGGIYVRIITNPEDIEYLYPHCRIARDLGDTLLDENNNKKPVEVWEFTVFGEQPGSVLYKSVSMS